MTVSQTALAGLALSAVISLLFPFLVYFLCRRRMSLPLRNIAIGAGIFVLFVVVLEAAMHYYFLKFNPVTSAWLGSHPWGFAAYGAGAAALYEETGRYMAMRLFVKRAGDPGTAVSYGIGHGGAESIIVGALGQISAIVMAVMLNMGTLDAVLGSKVPAAALAKIHAQFAHLNFALALAGGFERVWALLIQIALSLLVWRAVARKQIRWYFAAMAMHFTLDFPAALTQKGVISIFTVEIYVTLIGLCLLVFFFVKLPRRSA